jgi:hypothetical protein
MRFQRNISLLFRNGGSSARGVYRCRARQAEKATSGLVEKATADPCALEGSGELPAPRDSHPRLPPMWRRGSSLPCSSPTRPGGPPSHRFFQRARARSCRHHACTPTAGSRTQKAQWLSEMRAAQAGSRTPEAQWLPEGDHQIPVVMAQGTEMCCCARGGCCCLCGYIADPTPPTTKSPIRHSSSSRESCPPLGSVNNG